MYAYIKGKIVLKTNTYIVIENNGIGYKIFMSTKSIEKIKDDDKEIKIHTFYYVREDNISLYGFLSNDELRMFELLLQVSGIGAKTAIAILSEISTADFAMSVIANDTSKLVKIPGIGPKSAARLILELQDKLKNEDAILKGIEGMDISKADDKSVSEAISALQVLGYTKKELDDVFEDMDMAGMNTEDIIKAALRQLGM